MNEFVYKGFAIKYLYNYYDNSGLFHICIGMDNITGNFLYREYKKVLEMNHLITFNEKNNSLDVSLYWIIFTIHLIDKPKAEDYAKEMCDTFIELLEG